MLLQMLQTYHANEDILHTVPPQDKRSFYLYFLVALILGMSLYYMFGYPVLSTTEIPYILTAMSFTLIISYGFSYYIYYQKLQEKYELEHTFITRPLVKILGLFEALVIYQFLLSIYLYSPLYNDVQRIILLLIIILFLFARVVIFAIGTSATDVNVFQYFKYKHILYALVLYVVHSAIYFIVPSSDIVLSTMISIICIMLFISTSNILSRCFHKDQTLIVIGVILCLILFRYFGDINFPDTIDKASFYGEHSQNYTTLEFEASNVKKILKDETHWYVQTDTSVLIYNKNMSLQQTYLIDPDPPLDNDTYPPMGKDTLYSNNFQIVNSNEGIGLMVKTPDAIYNHDDDTDRLFTIYSFDAGRMEERLVLSFPYQRFTTWEYFLHFTEEGVYLFQPPTHTQFFRFFRYDGLQGVSDHIYSPELITDTAYVHPYDCEDVSSGICYEAYTHHTSTFSTFYSTQYFANYHKEYLYYNTQIEKIGENIITVPNIDYIVDDVLGPREVRTSPYITPAGFKVQENGQFLILGHKTVRSDEKDSRQYVMLAVDKNGTVIDYAFHTGDRIIMEDTTAHFISADSEQEWTVYRAIDGPVTYTIHSFDLTQYQTYQKQLIGANSNIMNEDLVISKFEAIATLIIALCMIIPFDNKLIEL